MSNPEANPGRSSEHMAEDVLPADEPVAISSAADASTQVADATSSATPQGQADGSAPPVVEIDLAKVHEAIVVMSKGMAIIANNNKLWTENNINKPELIRLRGDTEIQVKKIGELENKLRDTETELLGAQGAVAESAKEIQKLESDVAANVEAIRLLKEAEALSEQKIVLLNKALADTKETLVIRDEELNASNEACKLAGSKIEGLNYLVSELEKTEKDLRLLLKNRLAQHVPESLLGSAAATQLLEFDAAASRGDPASQRVLAGLSQLRAGFAVGAGVDDKLISVRSIGSALFALCTDRSMDAKAIHGFFVEWQNYLNAIPGAGYQIVVPDLGQNVPPNVNAPTGVTKVSQVQLWIVKGGNGAVYSKGFVR